ncbi:hypothetical protein PG985_012991 [Apiospora marii]|uniref:Nephrocystin 3-like N-terminal domain-containing protein n=1 Tax=Apiospora marii TaxID=335849 RepID=A0ABR1RCS4_9PEZI
MEALAAVGLATNVIAFVDFAAKLLKGAKEISSRGSLAELDQIQNGTTELQRFTKELMAPTAPPRAGAGKELDRLARECAALANEMIQMLSKINASGQASSLNSVRKSWRALRTKGKLDSIQNRLGAYRESILEQIAFLIRQDQASLFELANDISKRQDDNAEQVGKRIESLRHDLITALDEGKVNTSQEQSDIAHILKDVKSKMESLICLDSEAKRARSVLDKLWFDGMLSREASVNDPSGKSYRWVLQPPTERSESLELREGGFKGRFDEEEYEEEDSEDKKPQKEGVERELARNHFNRWLEFESGLFYISGKPGSGKSTLMKFLAQDSHTRRQLRNWAAAAGRQLVLASFFFWISGTTLQKSVEGLYRAILWEILKQCPGLIPDVLPSRWKNIDNDSSRLDHLPLSLSEIQQAFGMLQNFLGSRHALCLFIDGLDEFDGDHWKLGNELASWKSDHVKICVSARPYNGFQKTLPLNSSRHFKLHELNREDMQEHTRGELLKDERFCQLQNEDPSSAWILTRISDGYDFFAQLRASGRYS